MNGKMRPAPNCDAQIPLLSKVGRGIQGNSFKVEAVDSPSGDATYLEGYLFNETEKAWTKQWTSGNVNGGKLSVDYEYRSFTMPPTFVIKFTYSRPGHEDWVEKTPPIPYDPTGAPGTVGSYVGSVYFREWAESGVDNWQQLVIAPEGTDIPARGADWSVSLEAGVRGSLKLVTSSDLEAALDCTNEVLQMMAAGIPLPYHGAKNVRDYIDKADQDLSDRIDTIVPVISKMKHYRLALVPDPGNYLVGANTGFPGTAVKSGHMDIWFDDGIKGQFIAHVVADCSAENSIYTPATGVTTTVYRPRHAFDGGSDLFQVVLPPECRIPTGWTATPTSKFIKCNKLIRPNLVAAAGEIGNVYYMDSSGYIHQLMDNGDDMGLINIAAFEDTASGPTNLHATFSRDIVRDVTMFSIDDWFVYEGPLTPYLMGFSGAPVEIPSVLEVTSDRPATVVLAEVPSPWTGQAVEYRAYSGAITAWQNSPIFPSLNQTSSNVNVQFQARAKANADYIAGPSSTSPRFNVPGMS